MRVDDGPAVAGEPARAAQSRSGASRAWRSAHVAALVAVLALAAVLRFANLSPLGLGSHYYAAAVASMQTSWGDFFFLAAEPGGSLSVDKPPLGLWLQALSVRLFGLSTLGVMLPQLLAGVASVALVYHLARRSLGAAAGLFAALIMAATPVAVSASRSNHVDSLLVLALLLAAWGFLVAAETGKLRPLLWGACAVGAAFNIKMLQAYLPVPALYALYLLGAPGRWRRRLAHLALATLLLLGVSFCWVAAVDFTPPQQRPHVGSSPANSALDLALGHNGLEHLLDVLGKAKATVGTAPRTLNIFPGTPGPLRLVTEPLSREAGWLLPLALAGCVALAVRCRRGRSGSGLRPLLLWGGWMLTTASFLSAITLIHEYYLVLLAPPLAVLGAAAIMGLFDLARRRLWAGGALTVAVAAATLVYQARIAWPYVGTPKWQPLVLGMAGLGIVLLLWAALRPLRRRLASAGLACLAAAMLVTPVAWSVLTCRHPNALTSAYAGQTEALLPPGGIPLKADAALLEFLGPRTRDVTYLIAMPTSIQGSDYVLATGRPVLYLTGFNGSDEVLTRAQLDAMLCGGQLRYVYWSEPGSGSAGHPRISAWVATRCAVVPGYETATRNGNAPDGTVTGARGKGAGVLHLALYECACSETQVR